MRRRLLLLPVVFLLSACRRDEIRSYTAPKESPAMMPPMPSSSSDAAPAVPVVPSPVQGTPKITWKAPARWQEKPATAMRVGSFLIKGANGRTADLSVVPLSGEAGGQLANVNRWRGQIDLPPVDQAGLAGISRTLELAGRRYDWVDFANDKPGAGEASPRRITVAITRDHDVTWFFKLSGDEDTVRRAQAELRDFLSTVRFHE